MSFFLGKTQTDDDLDVSIKRAYTPQRQRKPQQQWKQQSPKSQMQMQMQRQRQRQHKQSRIQQTQRQIQQTQKKRQQMQNQRQQTQMQRQQMQKQRQQTQMQIQQTQKRKQSQTQRQQTGKFPCVTCSNKSVNWKSLITDETDLEYGLKIDKVKHELGRGTYKIVFNIPGKPNKVLKFIGPRYEEPDFYVDKLERAIQAGLMSEITMQTYIHTYGSSFLKKRVAGISKIYDVAHPADYSWYRFLKETLGISLKNDHTLGIEEDKLSGSELSDVDNNTLTNEDILAIACQGFRILNELHDMSIVHHDIKLDNLMYDKLTKKLSIVDFGFACTTRCCACERNQCAGECFECCNFKEIGGGHRYYTPLILFAMNDQMNTWKQIPQKRPEEFTFKHKCMKDVFGMGVCVLMLMKNSGNIFYNRWTQDPRLVRKEDNTIIMLKDGYMPDLLLSDPNKVTSMDIFLKHLFNVTIKTEFKNDSRMLELSDILSKIFFGKSKNFSVTTEIPTAKKICDMMKANILCTNSKQKYFKQR